MSRVIHALGVLFCLWGSLETESLFLACGLAFAAGLLLSEVID